MILTVPNDEEMKKEYRSYRQKVLWRNTIHESATVWRVNKPLSEGITLKLDPNVTEFIIDNNTLKIPSLERINDNVFSALAKLNRTICIPLKYFDNLNFFDCVSRNNYKFGNIDIIGNSDKEKRIFEIAEIIVSKKTWDIFSKYSPTKDDIRSEYLNRLDKVHKNIGEYGIVLCFSWFALFGAILLVFGTVLVTCDSIGTGVRYAIIKHKNKNI